VCNGHREYVLCTAHTPAHDIVCSQHERRENVCMWVCTMTHSAHTHTCYTSIERILWILHETDAVSCGLCGGRGVCAHSVHSTHAYTQHKHTLSGGVASVCVTLSVCTGVFGAVSFVVGVEGVGGCGAFCCCSCCMYHTCACVSE
jgi:hypothetical protein